ncbi:HlyC/CorC family transporter [Arsenicitalea aurantiaca]|uniref:HlyC/CorC family transporter n=1 Tax=Arsenicitalea aurantiaca TaxID=1783274 RepID=A0A433X5U1_9HYPH|nr:HlyC/CorC family transporter [Arsenicitalea aurantiaca]RUT29450.1 HlyC/CorC family transporter [Arsenicitalea aurantiaca]
MTFSLWLTSAGILVLLAMSFFFSGSETALTAASRVRIHQLARGGSKRAGMVEKLIQDKERLIGAILLGNNIVNILASTLAASVLIQLFGEAGIVYATIVMTAAVVVFSEVLPKTLAIMRPDGFALGVAPVIRIIVIIFAPVTHAVQLIVNTILRVFGLRADGTNALSGHEEIRGTVEFLQSEGEVKKQDADMLEGLLDLRDLQVSDVMVHRTQMFALDIDAPPSEIVKAVLEEAYTRIPVYRGDADNIVGVLHVKDVLRAMTAAGGDPEKISIETIAVAPWFVSESTRLLTQLGRFRSGQSHLALVIDEYGEVQGLITLEDILEEIVGQIADEHDEEVSGITREADGNYLVEGSVLIRDLNRALDWDLPEEDASTIAGLVIDEAKMIPEEGQEFTILGFRFVVIRKLHNRLTQLRITPLETEAGDRT